FASLPFPVELHKADELLWMSLSGKVQVDARVVLLGVGHRRQAAAIRQRELYMGRSVFHARCASFPRSTAITRRWYTVFWVSKVTSVEDSWSTHRTGVVCRQPFASRITAGFPRRMGCKGIPAMVISRFRIAFP